MWHDGSGIGNDEGGVGSLHVGLMEGADALAGPPTTLQKGVASFLSVWTMARGLAMWGLAVIASLVVFADSLGRIIVSPPVDGGRCQSQTPAIWTEREGGRRIDDRRFLGEMVDMLGSLGLSIYNAGSLFLVSRARLY